MSFCRCSRRLVYAGLLLPSVSICQLMLWIFSNLRKQFPCFIPTPINVNLLVIGRNKWSFDTDVWCDQAHVSLGSRWQSDLLCGRSLILPLTLMAVELSGDTGAPMQSYIHVQSVQSISACHNNYDRTIETCFFCDSLTVPLVFPLIGLGGSQSHCHFSQLNYFVAQSNFHRLCSSYSDTPKGSSHHMCMTTPCRIDKVLSSKCLSELSLIIMAVCRHVLCFMI